MSLLFTDLIHIAHLRMSFANWRGAVKGYAGRQRRGATLVGVSLMMLVAVGGISTYIKILAEEAQQADAIEVARLVTQHAANLDFWVHSKRATLAALVGAGGVISLTAAQTAQVVQAQTSPPFASPHNRNWSIQYLVVRPIDEALPFGLVVAKPLTPRTLKISGLAQSSLAERISAVQLGGGLSGTLDARGYAAIGIVGGLNTADIAIFSYTLNGLNKDLVAREAYAGYSTPSLTTNMSLGNNALHGALEVDATTAVVGSLTASLGAAISTQSLALSSGANVERLAVSGDVQSQALSAQSVMTSSLEVVGQTTAQLIEASQRATLTSTTILGNAGLSALYARSSVVAQNLSANAINSPAMAVAASLSAQGSSWDRLTLETLDLNTLIVTGGCTGC